MAKRGAEDQLTKDDVESGGAGRSDEEEEEQVRRDAPKEALASRQIRGLPKRKPATIANTSAAASSTTIPLFGAAPKSNAPAFSFSNPSAASGGSNPFAFAPPPSSSKADLNPASSSNPFGAFAFGSAAPKQPSATQTNSSSGTSAFGFGSATGAGLGSSSGGAGKSSAFGPSGLAPPLSSTPPAVSTSASGASDQPAPAKSPFAAFSFGAPAAATTPSAGSSSSFASASVVAPPVKSHEPAASAPDPSTSKPSPFSGFSFGAPIAATNSAASIAPTVRTMESSDVVKSKEPEASTSVTEKVAESEDDKTLTYLTSIRGLNESIIRALEVTCRQDPFVNLGEALGRLKREYEAELRGLKQAKGETVGDEGVNGMEVEVPEKEVVAPPVDKQVPMTTPAQPLFQAPRAISQKLAPLPQSATTSTASVGGFKPSAPITAFSFGGKTIGVGADSNVPPVSTAATPSTGFSFKPTSAASTTPSKPTSAAAALVQGILDDSAEEPSSTDRAQSGAMTTTTTPAKPPTFSFASTTPTSSPAPPSLAKRPSAIFAIKPEVRKSVGGGSNAMVVPKSSDASNPVPFVFKANNTGFNIGSSGSTAAPATPAVAHGGFGFSPMKSRTTSAGFSFGKTDSAPTTPAGGEGSAPSKPAFSFGAPPVSTSTNATTTTSTFSFGKPGEGAAKPPTFTFGAPAAATSGDGTTPNPPVFAFGAPAANQASGSSTAATNAVPDETSTEPASVDASAPQSGLTTGAGEEDEETLWESKAQIGVLTKNDEGKMVWADWKVCMVKLKREHKKEGQDDSQPMRRMLMRVDPSGHVHQNFSLRSLHTILPLGPSGLKLSVAATDGLKQIGMRFGKKSAAFDPEPIMQKFKSSVNAERRAMKLGEV